MDYRLEAYVAEGCYGCDEARALAREISTRFPELQMAVIDLEDSEVERPSAVFAVPTYLFNGELLWLGNPQLEEAIQQIASFLNENERA